MPTKRADLLAMAQDLFDVVLSGAVKIEINQTYPLQGRGQGPSGSASPQDHRINNPDGVAVQPDGWISPRLENEAA